MNWKMLVIGVLLAAVVALFRTTVYYRDLHSAALDVVSEQQDTINDMQRRQKDVALLDEKYIRELADAQKTIDDLRNDVSAGNRRLHIAARCQKPASAARVDNAASPGLTDAAERNYFILRERIEIANKQIPALQEYIKTQCLK